MNIMLREKRVLVNMGSHGWLNVLERGDVYIST